MAPVDNTVQEVRSRTLRLIQRYEQGGMTLRDLAGELAQMSPLYEHAMGGLADHYQPLLAAAWRYDQDEALEQELESALTEFRRTAAARE